MRLLAWSIVVVGIATALLVWGCFRLICDAEKMQRDPTLLRRRMVRLGLFYICCAVLGIVRVVTGDLPPMALIGLPVTAGIAWILIKQANNVKIPPP
jgi:hypothetical protein